MEPAHKSLSTTATDIWILEEDIDAAAAVDASTHTADNNNTNHYYYYHISWCLGPPPCTSVSLSIWICNDVKFYIDIALQYCRTHTLQVIARRGVMDLKSSSFLLVSKYLEYCRLQICAPIELG